MPFLPRCLLLVVLCVLAIPFAPGVRAGLARDVFVSPLGSGDLSGNSARDSLPAVKVNTAIRKAGGPITVIYNAGSYRMRESIKILGDGEVNNAPVSVRASDGAQFRGASFPMFVLRRGGVTISGFKATGFKTFLDIADGYAVGDVRLSRLDLSDMDVGIGVVNKGGASRNWVIDNVRITKFRSSGIRVSGPGVSGITISNATIDGAGVSAANADCYRGGIQIYNRANNITISGSRISNTVSYCGKYHQGDGIEADDSDGAPYDIRLSNLVLSNNRDGNLDLKARNVTMANIRSQKGAETRFAFRLWHFPYRCNGCTTDGGAVADLFIQEASVSFTGSSFAGRDPTVHCGEEETKPLRPLIKRDGNGVSATCVKK